MRYPAAPPFFPSPLVSLGFSFLSEYRVSMYNKPCEYPGCSDIARPADAEYREWHPDDKRPIYCDPHCTKVDREGEPSMQKYSTADKCGYMGCGSKHTVVCFWCKAELCRLHSWTPLAPVARNFACPDCHIKIKSSWKKQPVADDIKS